MTDVLRRYPDAAAACVEVVAAIPEEDIEEPAAREAYLWVVGEYGAQIQVGVVRGVGRSRFRWACCTAWPMQVGVGRAGGCTLPGWWSVAPAALWGAGPGWGR